MQQKLDEQTGFWQLELPLFHIQDGRYFTTPITEMFFSQLIVHDEGHKLTDITNTTITNVLQSIISTTGRNAEQAIENLVASFHFSNKASTGYLAAFKSHIFTVFSETEARL